MKTQVTIEQILEAAKGARSVTDVARRLGLCGATMSGYTGPRLRTLVPELEDIVRANRERIRTFTQPKWMDLERISPKEAAEVCPYRRGLYRLLFIESNVAFHDLDLLVQKLVAMGQKESAVRYAWAVLKNPNHRSNGKRSTALAEGSKVKLVALKKKSRIA